MSSNEPKLDLYVNPKFEKVCQAASVVGDAVCVQGACYKLAMLAEKSQVNLRNLMEAVQKKVSTKGVQVTYYNPGAKTFDSMYRKATINFQGQVLRLSDVYRGSIVVDTVDNIPYVVDVIKGIASAYKFEIVQENNTFDKPWEDGYRDINLRLQDKGNLCLVGELQVHLCPVKAFTETVGHKAYEIIRELPDPKTPKPRWYDLH